MIYRPQFAYPRTPAGFYDEDSVQYFDQTVLPVLGASIASGVTVQNLPLQLEQGAPFLCRGIRWTSAAGLSVQFRDPMGNFLSSDLTPFWHAYQGGGLILSPSGSYETMTIPFEPEIQCPPGGIFLAFIQNPTAAPISPAAVIALFGVQRYRLEARRAA